VSERRLNVPNAVAGLRFLLAPGLVVAGVHGREAGFLLLFLALELADFLDGFLARLLDQRTVFGALLDSAADAFMYTCLVVGLVWLEGDAFTAAWPSMAMAGATWGASAVAGLARFGRLPSYHTWSAKVASVLVVGAVALLVLGGDASLVRITAVTVTVANLEALLLTWRLDRPEPDLASALLLLWGRRSRGREKEPEREDSSSDDAS
jgi:CDP-diacylglycerol--glycerol-3-phosphate 3-phosphatidyltransferase